MTEATAPETVQATEKQVEPANIPPVAAAEAKSTSPLAVISNARATKELGVLPRQDMETMLARAAARENVKTPEACKALIERMQARYHALIAALGTDSPATHAFAHRFDADNKGHVANENNVHGVSMQVVQSIFANRADDIAATQKELANLTAEALHAKVGAEGFAAPTIDTTLTPEKLEEERRTIILGADGKIEAPAHFARTFLEQRKFHIGLAQGFAADSDVAKALQASLEQALPNDDKAALKGFLDDWLTFRRERAQHVADAMLLDGEMVQTSVAEWEAQRLGKLQALTSDNENTKETPKEAAAATSPVANDNGTTPAPNVAVPEKPAMAHAVQEIPPSILNAVNIAQDNIKQIEEKIATGTGRA